MGLGFINTKKQYIAVILVLLISFIIRIYLSQFEGHRYDIPTFYRWSQAVYNNGFLDFYSSTNADYPPFYIYILWLVSAIYKLFFPLNADYSIFTIFLKTPAGIFDIVTAFLIFSIVRKYTGFKAAFLTMIVYVFNPAVIYNSAIWGQVDSVNTLFILLALMFMISNRLELMGACLAVAILTKVQSLVLLPLIGFLMVENEKPLKLAKVCIVSLAIFIALALPFYLKTSLYQLIDLYAVAYDYFQYNSLNAFNLWAFFGFWKPDNTSLLFLDYRKWSYILFYGLLIYLLSLTSKNRYDKSIYYASVILFFGFFMLLTRIHERYLFSMFAPLAIVMNLDKRLRYVFGIMTFTFWFNLYYVLQFSHRDEFIPDGDPYVLLISVINLGMLIYTLYCFSTFQKGKRLNRL